MARHLRKPLQLGDVEDVEAYVRRIVSTLDTSGEGEFDELVADGLELVAQRHRALQPGESLAQALKVWLAWRLRDRWRNYHREWRRDARAATAYALPVATGLAWEHGAREHANLRGPDEQPLIESRLSLAPFQKEADLRDPRLIGRYLVVPSWGAPPTGAAGEIWATIEAERQLPSDRAATQPPPFAFKRDLL